MSVDAAVGVAPTVPGLAATVVNPVVGQLMPGVGTELSRPLRGLVSFVLVLVAGALVLRLRRNYVNESIDAISDSPATAVLYGIAGYVIVGIVGLYGATTLARLSVAGGVFVRVAILISSAFVLVLTSFGFLVVGTLLTDIFGSRRPTYGLLIGAFLSAVSWVLLSPAGSIVSSLAIAAFGIGGSARIWIHSERTVETELGGR
ncbi:hypothetical protein ACNO8S_16745 (plasmid) [Haloarcula sp. KBTZ06]|uniref:hypothetical protein n=1 Tax=unclassified Haloarcula TaxID=2624677 RepID=UPI00059557AB|nr:MULTISPECIES: hypothetical protein [unclassified Haloarcula]AJF27501.1 hypothetical protein SG26_17120 [Haloarcula sp. CBA1115]KAA9404229.1 hypothetical protein Har1131_15500 [Haloarcula sp. CBA1131]MUV48313.1 hypothetical protein [Haloarcula sp. CBA1122]